MGAPAAPVGNIVLVGFMGSGKTEVGRRLAERTGRRFLDTDELIESTGASIRDIFASEGETGFRRREREAIAKAARTRRTIIATGGGAVLDPVNVKALKRSGVLVYLRLGADELVGRLEGSQDRPLLDDELGAKNTDAADARRRLGTRVRKLLKARESVYEEVADLVVGCNGLGPEPIVGEILRLAALTPEPTGAIERVTVGFDPPYDVVVGSGLLERIEEHVGFPAGVEKLGVISHPRVKRLWGQAVASGLGSRGPIVWLTFPEGEERKTGETATRLDRQLARAAFHRTDAIVALGGGVVGDVAGFVASTYVRGIPLLQVPTTLLAMVDAAIGGKTGVNLPEGKNLVGTFHQPFGVVADLDTLRSLPERELRGGLAEVAKYALIAEPELGELVVEQADAIFAREAVLRPIVVRSAAIKARVVAADEREGGIRAILNYGHTLGHALEGLALAGRLPARRGAGTRLHHGEAIAVGMVFAAWVSVLMGLAREEMVAEHRRLLAAVGLPTAWPGLSWEDVRRFLVLDKKYAGGTRLVLLRAPGDPVVQGDVGEDVLIEALRRVTEG